MKSRSPWTWIPTLYFAEGLPYVAVMSLTTVMYLKMGLSNTEMAFYTGWLYLPWVIKPFWSPFVDILKTKRWWIWTMQLLIGAGMAGVALFLPASFYLKATLAIFWLVAFSSATHDIAADGFYMLALPKDKQAFFIGIRNTFYRIAMITGQGLLVMLAGIFEKQFDNIPKAWSLIFYLLAAVFIGVALWHRFILPLPAEDKKSNDTDFKQIISEFGDTFVSFFKKKGIGIAILFILLFRFGESQLLKMSVAFLLDNANSGGLELTTQEVGFINGTVGVIALLLGGILGGIMISFFGLRKLLWLMTLAVALPNVGYLILAIYQPDQLWITSIFVGVEQFGYGFGVTAYTMYMMLFSDGKYKTSHYAICTGFMALGMMLPGMFSGLVQSYIGYQNFFIWVLLCSVPIFLILPFLKIRE